MANYNRRKRFPRAAYSRRVEKMMDELRNWHFFYEEQVLNAHTPVSRQKLIERAKACDSAWHILERAAARIDELTWH